MTILLESYIMQLAESEASGFLIAPFDLAVDLAGLTHRSRSISCIAVSLKSLVMLRAVSERLRLAITLFDAADSHNRILSLSSDNKEDPLKSILSSLFALCK